MTISQRIIATVLTAALASFASPAQAQIGGLIKKAAKKAAAEAADDRSRRKLPASSNAGAEAVIGAELTADTLDKVLAGLAAVADRRAAIKSLQAERDRAAERRSAFLGANGATLDAYRGKRNAFDACSGDFERELNAKREPELKKRLQAIASSPNRQQFMDEFNRMTVRATEAQQRGDSATLLRLQREYQRKVLGIDPAADSTALAARCGTRPVPPKQLAEQERFDDEVRKLDDRLREAEAAAEGAGPTVSGLSATRFALARERLLTWMGLDRNGQASKSFGEREHQLLSSRKGDIVRLLNSGA